MKGVKINEWSSKFESHDTRKRQRLGWFLSPTGCDSRGYRLLMRKGTEGVIALGVFQALCQALGTLSKDARKTGVLANSDGSGMEMADLREITRISAADLGGGLALLEEIGWITQQFDESAAPVPEACRTSAGSVPQNSGFVQGEGEEEEEGEDISPQKPDAKPSLPRNKYSVGFELWWKAYKRPNKGSKKAAGAQWKAKKLEGREVALIAKANEYAASVESLEYMAHGERFLSKELYEDEYTPHGQTKPTGISEELQERMFKPFEHQGGTVSSAYDQGGVA